MQRFPIMEKQLKQRGAALLITLVLIALVSLLVFSNSQSVRVQQQLSSNEQASQIAFQAAEMALKQAATELESSINLSQFCNAGKSYAYVINDIDELRDDDHWMEVVTKGQAVSFSGEGGYGGAMVPQAPRYMIGCINPDAIEEYVKTQSIKVGQSVEETDRHYFFRVFAVGFGPAGQMTSTLEGHYVY